jgi:hypothetical protein
MEKYMVSYSKFEERAHMTSYKSIDIWGDEWIPNNFSKKIFKNIGRNAITKVSDLINSVQSVGWSTYGPDSSRKLIHVESSLFLFLIAL